MKLKGKVSIVTGAANGIGKATAYLLGLEGSHIIAVDIDLDGLNKNIKYLKKQGINADAVKLDIKNLKEIKRVVADILRDHKKIDILVNNAGRFSMIPILEMTEMEWDEVMNINLKGTFFMSKEVIPAMIKQRYGKIINIASLSAKRGGITSGTNYGASKAGVISVTKYFAQFCAPYGINVNAVVPGFVDTAMFCSNPRERINKVIKSIPLGRLAKSEEIAKVIYFLASEDSSYITGEILDVNGGVLMD